MKAISTLLTLLVFCLLAVPNVAHAQATRTWVSGVGDDANPCSRTAPCKTFAGAISKTAASGEINCLDPGGFGALTITKAITIDCEAGTAGVLVSGTNGITVAAGTGDAVFLKGLDFEGLYPPSGTAGLVGVKILTAEKVGIQDCVIRGFATAGIQVANSSSGVHVDITGSTIADNAGEGIQSLPGGGFGNRVMIDHSTVSNNVGDGIMANGTETSGIGSIKMTIRNTESAHNGGDGIVAFSSGQDVEIMVDASTSFDNNRGINASGSGAIARFTRSTITANVTGVNEVNSGMALSYGTNSIDGNGSGGSGSFSTLPQQ